MAELKEQLAGKTKGMPLEDGEVPPRQGIVPKTDFGRELLALRNQAIAAGMKVRSADEILAEIEESRRP